MLLAMTVLEKEALLGGSVFILFNLVFATFGFTDDGISPERIAQVMGLPDRCQHAAHIINELILTAQVGFVVFLKDASSIMWGGGIVKGAT